MERKTRAAIRSIGRSLSLASGASTKPYNSGAVVTTIDGGTAWVLVDGSDEPMPVTKSIDCKPGDRVQVRVTSSSAHVTGNVTAPPTDDAQAVVAQEQTQAVQTQVTKTAETVEQVVVTGTLDRINIGTGNTVPAESAAIGRRNTLGSQAGGIPSTVRSFVLGSRNTAMGTKNFIVGDVNSVAISGDLWADTYVFGDMNTVSSTGHGFVFGQYNTIGGDEITYPVCFGVENELVGQYPFALGYSLIAHSNQYVFGRANVEDANEEYAIVFGNGTVSGETDTRPETVTRSNAFTMDWSGNVEVAGSVKPGNTTAGRAVITGANGEVTTSSVTSTELNRLHGVTSGVQAQLDSKLNASSVEITTANGYIYVLFSVDDDNKLQVRANATTQAVRTKISGTWSSWRTI